MFAPIHFTQGSGKMTGIQSVNTSTLENAFCSKMRDSDSVCAKCYAARYENMRPSLENKLIHNSKLLSETVISIDSMPYVNASILRGNSFGELINLNHAINIFNLALKNKHLTLTLWTKRKDIIAQAIEKQGKPDNLILIYSSPVINKASRLPLHFDKVFTVYNKNDVENQSVTINCGSKSCIDCMTCYTKNNVSKINELQK